MDESEMWKKKIVLRERMSGNVVVPCVVVVLSKCVTSSAGAMEQENRNIKGREGDGDGEGHDGCGSFGKEVVGEVKRKIEVTALCPCKDYNNRIHKAVLENKGHVEVVLTVAFSPDGQQLTSGSDDTTVRFTLAQITKLVNTAQPVLMFRNEASSQPSGSRQFSANHSFLLR
ncbi:hypothetical protein JHK85_034622 [Glycine max]|nr:hypothetical protein JHK85_034622 [Glycine max]